MEYEIIHRRTCIHNLSFHNKKFNCLEHDFGILVNLDSNMHGYCKYARQYYNDAYFPYVTQGMCLQIEQTLQIPIEL